MFFDEVRVYIFPYPNKVRSIFWVFLQIVGGGGTADKRIPEDLFLRFSKKFVFTFSHIKESLVYDFRVFVHSTDLL